MTGNAALVGQAMAEAAAELPDDDVLSGDFFAELIANSPQRERVDWPDGGKVWIVKLKTVDRLRLYQEIRTDTDADDSPEGEFSQQGVRMATVLLSYAIRDRQGNAPFDSDAGREYIDTMDPVAITPLARVAYELNGFSRPRAHLSKKKPSETS